MFYRYIFICHIFCQSFRCCQCFFHIHRNSGLTAADTGHSFYFVLHSLCQTVYIHIHFLQQLRNETILLLQESQ